MAKIEITETELVWQGKYNEDGILKEVPRVSLTFHSAGRSECPIGKPNNQLNQSNQYNHQDEDEGSRADFTPFPVLALTAALQ